MTELTREEVEAGLVFYVLKRADQDGDLFGNMGIQEAEEGWAYFDVLKDASGGISASTFQEQVKKAVIRAVKEADAASLLANYIKGALGSFASSINDFEGKVLKVASKLIGKFVDATPVFATAVFRLFGKSRDRSSCAILFVIRPRFHGITC